MLAALKGKNMDKEKESGIGKFVSLLRGNYRFAVRSQDLSVSLWGDPKEKRIVVLRNELPPVKVFLKVFVLFGTDRVLHSKLATWITSSRFRPS